MEVTPHNAFTPAKEVQDIDRFAGRERELLALSSALQSDGAQLVLYGQRGIGKSSLARVLLQLATSDPSVIARLRDKPFAPFDYVPIYLSCDDSISSIDRLLVRLLTDDDALAPWVPFRVIEKKSGGEGGGGINVKILQLSGKIAHSVTERATEVDADVTSTFVIACREVVKSGVARSGLLIVIDEFDRIKDHTGLASLMKALGPEKVTFALVGVATTIQDLISEHESVGRQLTDGAVHVEPMSDSDLHEIVKRAMDSLGGKFSFDAHAANWIVSIARGHPFYVHLIGKHALLRTISAGANVVTEAVAREALAEIALKGSAPIQESLYKTAIGHSYLREHILKRFAEKSQDEIHTTELYAGIARELGIDPGAVSVYVGHLASEKYGAVLVKTRDRYYRFVDSLFKAYAAARPFELAPGDKEEDV
jgi:Cdc6-like AAA superfamily ATPase